MQFKKMSEVSEGKKPELLAPGSYGRKKERGARGRHLMGDGAPAWEAHENSFYLLFECAENSYWLRDPRGDKFSRWAKKFSLHVFLARPVLSCTYFFHLFLYIVIVSIFYDVER